MKNFEIVRSNVVVKFYKESDKNMVKSTIDGNLYFECSVSKQFGNYFWKELRSRNEIDQFILDLYLLELMVYENNFDSYSDFYKDINNVRPHFTHEEWNKKVEDVRKRINN